MKTTVVVGVRFSLPQVSFDKWVAQSLIRRKGCGLSTEQGPAVSPDNVSRLLALMGKPEIISHTVFPESLWKPSESHFALGRLFNASQPVSSEEQLHWI